MKIESSTIAMASSHIKQEVYKKEERLESWVGERQPQNPAQSSTSQTPKDLLQLSDEGKLKLEILKTDVQKTDGTNKLELNMSDKDMQKIRLLQIMLEKLTGKKFKFAALDFVTDKNKIDSLNIAVGQKNSASQRANWGLTYDKVETYSETEKMSFSAAGVINTSDGKTINFQTTLNMSRAFASQSEVHVNAGNAVDPLVINFAGNAPELTDTKFSFDLDSNGTSEQISFLKQGSGLLAIDLNSDGKINNGKELFGPNSGNGFSELAQYDTDKNNWIDENDSVYDKLRIWTKDESGNDKLFALGQKGIGAIFLGNIDTSFDMKNTENVSQGKVQSSSIFVKENGTVGTINQIDFVV